MNLRHERYTPEDMEARVSCPGCQDILIVMIPRAAMPYGRMQVTCALCDALFYVAVGDVGKDRIAVSVEPSPH
jgi:hypothetical protein